MNGHQRIEALFQNGDADRVPVLPILHTGLVPICGTTMRDYFTSAETMARVIIAGYRRFGYDGAQMSLGVTAEAYALGARLEFPENSAPFLRERLLADSSGPVLRERLQELERVAFEDRGGLPLFFDAVRRVVAEIGDEAFVLATLRGPLLIAAQLRGEEQMLMDLLTDPETADAILAFSTGIAIRAGRRLAASGAHGVVMGEAVCSPDFISPDLYRERIAPLHARVIREWRAAGWRRTGLHICGKIMPIVEDILSTGVDFFDVDSAVSPADAARLVRGRAVMRGNLDPSSVLRFGATKTVRNAARAFLEAAAGERWIAGSGCDVPPGTPAENIAALVDTVKASGRSRPYPQP